MLNNAGSLEFIQENVQMLMQPSSRLIADAGAWILFFKQPTYENSNRIYQADLIFFFRKKNDICDPIQKCLRNEEFYPYTPKV